VSAPTVAADACHLDTLDYCTVCGDLMHRGSGRLCHDGHRRHEGRGLCTSCHAVLLRRGLLDDHPRAALTRDELLDEWRVLARSGTSFRDFPHKVGMTYAAWERAFQRARNAGHPLARRYDKGT
jgi:hypothetical protein